MKKQYVKLIEADKRYLEDLLKKGSLTAKLYKRGTALLELNRSKSLKDVAATLGVSYQAYRLCLIVIKLRAYYVCKTNRALVVPSRSMVSSVLRLPP